MLIYFYVYLIFDRPNLWVCWHTARFALGRRQKAMLIMFENTEYCNLFDSTRNWGTGRTMNWSGVTRLVQFLFPKTMNSIVHSFTKYLKSSYEYFKVEYVVTKLDREARQAKLLLKGESMLDVLQAKEKSSPKFVFNWQKPVNADEFSKR